MADLSAATQMIVNRVLVVEDDPDLMDIVRQVLTQSRMDVVCARDAGQARSAFTMHLPDFVIMDVMLPGGVTGFELCDWMKQQNDGVPVLFLTAVTLDQARDLARRVGADGYMAKPFQPTELVSQVREIADRVWARKHLGDVPGADEKVRFQCPECKKHLRVNSNHRGRNLTCPKCGETVTVPRHD